jgi:hypothetical protein
MSQLQTRKVADFYGTNQFRSFETSFFECPNCQNKRLLSQVEKPWAEQFSRLYYQFS